MATRLRPGVLCFLVSLLLATQVIAEDEVADDSAAVKIHRDLVFAKIDGQALKLDLYVPDAIKNPPLVVWIHGGGWRAGSRKRPALESVTAHGYALASISYRFTDKAVFPAQIHDCKAAVRWLRANAKKFGFDGQWIAVAGSSAGGHLALLMGASNGVKELEGTVGAEQDQSSSVQAVIDYFGPSDFVLRGKTQPDRAYSEISGSYALLGGLQTGKLDPKMESFASPAHYVSADDPPLLAWHGKLDEVVLLDQSQHMVELCKQSGVQAQLVVIDDAGHGGRKFFTAHRLATAIKFLDSHRPE